MSWTWRYATDPAEGAPPPESFGSQGDAETWLGEVWRELLDGGVHAVTLTHDGADVYPMSLEPAE